VPAVAIVDRITGGRFELLTTYRGLDSEAKVDAKVKQLEGQLLRDLTALQVPHDHPFLKALTAAGPEGVAKDVFTASGLPMAKLAALLKANIIAAHTDGSYTFHSRFVQRYFQKVAGAASAVPSEPESAPSVPEGAPSVPEGTGSS